MKHTSFKQKIESEFGNNAIEIFKIEEKNVQNQIKEAINDNFAEKYLIQIPNAFGVMNYYGISNMIKPEKEESLIYFKKAYQLAKEKEYGGDKRLNYFYIYKCRKYLLKNNKITIRKLNKTKEKLFRF